ncbi:hypothetical protein [Actinomycetospora sp.]|uniref:hypothetical protein n=1 Tax=Actinomycetospora sp. TaxID=1872135 RepID=UPI002F41483E
MVVPSVSQQLAAIRHTLAKTVVPALDADADFAREQAGLVLASLDWAMDVVESEHRYEVVEHTDYRDLLSSLLAMAPGDDVGDAQAVLDATAESPHDLAGLREQTRALKRDTDAVFTLLARQDPAVALTARQLVSRVAVRQTERELAWTRMTGFPRNVAADVAGVLREQSRGAREPAA